MRYADIRGNRFDNRTSFGAALRRFLYAPEQLGLLPRFGWLDGGCGVLAQALVIWAPEVLSLGIWARKWAADPEIVEHAFAWAHPRRGEHAVLILDGDGAQSQAIFERKMVELEKSRGRCVFDPTCVQIEPLYKNESSATALARRLRERFGAFRPELIAAADPRQHRRGSRPSP